MEVVKLFCVIVGEAGSAFSVKVGQDQEVDDLKEAIKDRSDGKIDVPRPDLQLFLAKNGNAWLSSDNDDVKALKEGVKTTLIDELTQKEKELQGESGLKKVLAGMLTPSTDQIHVLVVIPDQSKSAPSVSFEGVLDRCRDSFFLQLPTAGEDDSWLMFPQPLPLTERQKLYIRSSYKSIAAQALSKMDPKRRKYAVVTGTPGVGKSVFLFYVMWKLIKEKKRVLLMAEEPAIYFDGESMWEIQQLPYSGNRTFWSVDLWCLVDSVDPTTIAGFPIRKCCVLLASTPRRDCIGEFNKLEPTPDVFYMPLWTKEELSTIAPLYPNAQDQWENRFEGLGGVPRLVLKDLKVTPQELLQTACSNCCLDGDQFEDQNGSDSDSHPQP
eukprot:jgi/Phyca11/570403/estExt2_Genewise1.C_PHYCAscaffold_370147